MVLAIGGILIAAIATGILNYMLQAKITTTQARMTAIDDALGQYLTSNGAYPCPASLTDPIDTATYGVQVSNDCFGAAVAGGTFRAASVAPAPNNTPIRIGAVPVRTLNLPDQYIDDAWNDRFYYAVTEILASPGNASVVPLYSPNGGSITIIDSKNNFVTLPPNWAHYAIMSVGEDRVGAYTAEGVVGMPCVTGTLESINCQQVTGQFRSTLLTGKNIGANTFDDFVVYHTTAAQGIVPTGLTVPFYNLAACPRGWIAPTAAQLDLLPLISPSPAPNYIYCQKQ